MSRFQFIEGVAKLRAKDVKLFDRLDFEGDPIADPNGDGTDGDHYESFEFEFAEVIEIERETPECIVIHTTQGSYGFPPEHLIDSTLEQPNAELVTARNSGGRWHAWFGDGHAYNVGGFLTEDEAIEELHERFGKAKDEEPTKLYQCGICDHWHRAAWNGDCRDDSERFDNDQVNDFFGNEGTGWVEVEMPGT